MMTVMLLSVPGAFAFNFEDFSFTGLFESFISIFKKNDNAEEKTNENIEDKNNEVSNTQNAGNEAKSKDSGGEKNSNTNTNTNINSNTNNQVKNSVQKTNTGDEVNPPVVQETVPEKPVKSVTLANITYTENDLKASMNNNAQFEGYIKGFGYDCLYINTDKGTKFTLFFDTANGKMTSMELKKDCDKEIYMEESIVTDLNENGFQASKIGSYIKKTKIPTGMYFKAMKVMVS